MTSACERTPERALILAPRGRDAAVAAQILFEAEIPHAICANMAGLMRDLREGAGFAIIVEEALHDQDYSDLARWVDAQPAWSDFPIVILAQRGGDLERNPAVARLTKALGNVTFLERPFHPTTLISVAQTAMRGRRRQYEARERLEELRAAEERFRTLADNIPTLCWMARPDGEVVWYNSRWYDYTGSTFAQMRGWGWERAVDPDLLPEVNSRWRHCLETGEPFEMTFPLKGADGVFRPFLTQVVPLRDEGGRIVRWFGTNANVTREHRDRERLTLMVNELNHRVKNTLATVQAIATLSLRTEEPPENMRDSLTARILALSKAHDVLTDTQWSGADLREIAALAGVPFDSGEGDRRIRADGPQVQLPPKTAIAVALAFHELATNAAKYGALSTPSGWIELKWTLTGSGGDADLRIVWREIGGPPVKRPRRTGFGTRLIQRGLAADLNGGVTIDYRPDGVVCVIEAKLRPAPETAEFGVSILREARSFEPEENAEAMLN